MNSWPRFWLAAGAVLMLSLTPKLVLGVLRARAPAPTSSSDSLRAFLAASAGGPVTPVLAKHSKTDVAGWGFSAGGCPGRAFLSDLPGNLDYKVKVLTPNGSRIAYIYEGRIAQQPPKYRLAIDVIAFRLASEFTPTRAHEPRYVVLAYPAACPASLSLPWDRLRLS